VALPMPMPSVTMHRLAGQRVAHALLVEQRQLGAFARGDVVDRGKG
jgi:hypothetical protein